MLVIDLEDISEVCYYFTTVLACRLYASQHERTVAELVSRIRRNTRRYVSLFCEVIDTIMPQPTKDISEHDEVIDIILHQRRQHNENAEAGQQLIPDHLLRR